MPNVIDSFNSQTFTQQLHTSFKVHLDGMDPLTLELVEVNEPPSPPRMELFLLEFRGPHSPRLKQQIYHLEHEKLGQFDLFLTAVAGDQERIQYEAVINRFCKDNQ